MRAEQQQKKRLTEVSCLLAFCKMQQKKKKLWKKKPVST